MSNVFKRLQRLLAQPPLLVGTVLATDGTTAVVEDPGGNRYNVRGEVTVGDTVFFRDGVVEGPAPALPFVEIEV